MKQMPFTWLVILCLLFSKIGISQPLIDSLQNRGPKAITQWQKQFDDDWFNERADSMLQIGEEFPDLSLSPIANNYTGAKTFHDLKGKVIILDYWTTNCGACIEAFPKMEQLQKQFQDKIQIFIVNPEEDQATINRILENRGKKTGKKIQLPNLPSIVGPREDILKLIPCRGLPHHVWIDQNSIVRVNGSYLNTYPEKVRSFLANGQVESANDMSNTPLYNPAKSYYKQLGKSLDTKTYNSTFYPYNKYVNPDHPYSMIEYTDTVTGTIRHTSINVSLDDILYNVFNNKLRSIIRDVIISPQTISDNGWTSMYDVFNYEVSDTFHYTWKLNPFRKNTDVIVLQSRFCYEQITPISWSSTQRREAILKDLNDHFRKLYGTKIFWENKKIPCYLLVRTSKIDKISGQEIKAGAPPSKAIIKDGKKAIEYTSNIKAIVANYRWINPESDMVHTPILDDSYSSYLFDETGFGDKKVHMIMPERVNNLEELRTVLKSYGLDIIKSERKMEFLTVKDKN